MQHTLSLKGYEKHDKKCEEYAIRDCHELIASYNRAEFVYSYTTNQYKEAELYKLTKMWHIMSGSGIFIDYKITKLRNDPERIRIRIQMSQQVKEHWDSDDEPTAKVETADPPQD
jgi:hypothetical protein